MLIRAGIQTVVAMAAVFVFSGIAGPIQGAQAAGAGGLSGTITQIGDKSISIQPNNGKPMTATIDGATVIKVNGQVAKAADLKIGMRALAMGEHISLGTPVAEIRAYEPKTSGSHSTTKGPAPGTKTAAAGGLSGMISQVGENSISIQLANGKNMTVNFNKATIIKVNGVSAKALGLKVGMRAMVIGEHISLGTPVTEIRAYQPKSPGTEAPVHPATGSHTATGSPASTTRM